MRVKKSLYNAISGAAILIIRSILMFVVRIVFIKMLGKELLGVDSLFTNLLLVLSIADSGMNTAISFSLYKPLSDKDYNKVSALMTFYKKVYRILGIIVTIVGLLFIPFLHIFINENIHNIYLYYIIYLLTTIVPYFISYKDSLLIADQNSYKSSLIVGLTYILMYILRIIFLYLIPDFMIYSVIQLIIIFIQRLLVNNYITKKYKHINFASGKKIDKSEQKIIYKSSISIFLNKLGFYLVNATDNIIISAIPGLGLGIVAVYTNYYSIIGAVDNIISRALSGITSSFGDLSVNESKKIQENVFDILSFVSITLYGLFAVGFMLVLSPFIKFCFGSTFELGNNLMIIICLNFYILGIIRPLDIVKEATGNYIKDRYANIIQAVLNITLSIILGNIYGLIGIILATLISYILVPLWNKPYIVYKYIFEGRIIKFFSRQFVYLLSNVLICIMCILITNNIHIDSLVLSIFVKAIIVGIMYILMISVLYFKTQEYKYLKNLIMKNKKKLS